jgi:flavin reductase (DIM6/NTAB) family NADH-FMN oxidoreductase RutF
MRDGDPSERAPSMFFAAGQHKSAGLPHNPFKAIVAPRPIGWISAMSTAGEVNLAPYSFFNAIQSNPDIVMFSSDGWKDAITFIKETGEFVCSLATYDLQQQMNMTSAPLPRGENEFIHAGLTMAPSQIVKPHSIAACCRSCRRSRSPARPRAVMS